VWLLIIINFTGKVAAVYLALKEPATAVALWFIPDALLAYHLFAPRAQGLVRACRRFATDRREVWLTIDDGPDPDDTPLILALLAVHGARATFFVIGENAAAHPDLIRAISEGGHEVAHHTHTHPAGSFWCASPARLAGELDAGLAVLRAAGLAPTRFRSPVGIKNLWLAPALAARGLVCVGWSARGLELLSGNADAVAERVLHGLKPGSILLLHEGSRLPPAIRVEAIRRTLERLNELGYQCVVPQTEQLLSS
jgi:peptidoglycan/xylan/chitin deacetylase (PgdA/CDA1 family)